MRIFLGIPISEEIRSKIEKIQLGLTDLGTGINLVQPENLHYTLKFFGEVEESKIIEVKEILKSIGWGNKFNVRVKKVGVFPNENYVKVVWLGVENDAEMKELSQKIEDKLGKQFPADFEFSAHLTLARVKFVKDKLKLLTS